MPSSYKFLYLQEYDYLSCLKHLILICDMEDRWMTSCQIRIIRMNLKFLDMFRSLQSFTNECSSMRDVIQKVQAALLYKRVNSLNDVESMFYKLEKQIRDAKVEIRDKYSFSEPLSSNVATPKFTDTVVRNLYGISKIFYPDSVNYLFPYSSSQKMEKVVKELKLLRSFVCFISNGCTDTQRKFTFFAHVLVVAGHAAMISWNASFSDLQMRIQPMQPCIREIYIVVLQTLKSGCHPNNQAEHVADYKSGLVEILVHHLEELVITGKPNEIVALKDRRPILSIYQEKSFEDFDTAVIDIGLLFYSLYESMEEKENMVVGDIQAVIYLITRKSFQSKLSKIDGVGSIEIILDHLKEVLSRHSASLSSIRSQLQTIQQQLENLQKQHDGFKSLGMQWCIIRLIGDIIEEITLLMREVANIHEKKVADFVVYNTSDVTSAHTSEFTRITSMREEMVGFQELVISHFDVRAQCCVSQVYTRKDLLLTILRVVKKDTVISDKLPENELADKLRKLLLVQRYLILIDDVWETIPWDDLNPCFCDANNGSRIILTTRVEDVASHAKLISDPHFLRLFTLEESWMLLKNKVFNKESCALVLEDVGKRIAQKCGGLPLSVVLVSGILKTMEKEKRCWERVAINLGPHIQAKSEDIISLSYQDLPFHLKPCFLYFGMFLEDEEIQVSKLTWLWTAQGLLETHTEMLSEDIAEYYLTNLIGRNLEMVSKRSSDGKTKQNSVKRKPKNRTFYNA
ncbi:unnamed protein product [Withania somnifera]